MKSTLLGCLASFFLLGVPAGHAAPIDRHALVTRHNVELRQFDASNPLSVGNGEFAFTVDATGLQTFPEAFEKTTPLGTLADWGWHTFPNPNGWDVDKFEFKKFPDLEDDLAASVIQKTTYRFTARKPGIDEAGDGE